MEESNKPKNVEEYIERNRAAVNANPGCGTSHYNLAIGLLGQRKYDEAEKEFLEAVDCSPNLAEAYVQLGGISLQRGDLQGCLSYNQQAIHSRAGFAEGHANIGFVYMQMGEIEKAIPSLLKAIRWNPKFLQAYTTLANAYLMQGEVDEAIETNLKAVELEPKFAVAHNNLGVAYLEKGLYDQAGHHIDLAREQGYEVAPEIIAELDSYKKKQ